MPASLTRAFVLVLAACLCVIAPSRAKTAETVQPGAAPEDIAVRLVAGDCSRIIIDTYKGEVVNDRGKRKGIKLSNRQKRELYDAVVAASFVDLTSPVGLLGHMSGDLDPYHVELKATIGSTTHEVAWSVGNVDGRAAVAASPNAVKLDALTARIRTVIEEDSGVKRFLRRAMLCL